MSRKQITKGIISVILTVLIGLMLPVQVFASTLPKDEKVYSSFDNVHGETETVGNIVTEISDSRTENTKEFLLDDGTTMIAEYNQPVHYKNDKGKWVEYNNTLVAESSASTADEASDGEYTNKSSNIDVKLSNKAKSNNMIKVTSDNYSISWGYDGANKSKINIVKNDEKLTGNDKFTTLKNITTEAKYENVYKNVDLQYFVTSTGVKENIILKSSDVQNEFNLTYKIKNLTAKQTDDYTITLYNKNNREVYKIVAPYMTDAKGESSNQLKLELVSQKGGNLQVRLTADYWFIHSIGRSYPITIDPEVTNKLTSALTFAENTNNSIKSYGPYYNSNNSYLICVVNSLPRLEDGEKIVSAKYNFEITNGSSQLTDESDNPIIINAHNLKSAANGVSEYDSDILDYDSLTYNDNQYASFDLTKTVNEWYDNGDSIDGFVLESFDSIGSKSITFKEATRTSTTPSLTIVYKDFKGTESNLSYHTIPVGHNAQASVSDYLGNLVINQSLYEGTGSRMPVTLTATYNSINYNTAFANGSPSGYGWQFSFNQYVRDASTALANKGYNYIYTDSDGTDHYLKKSDESEEWSDEDGLGITLTKTDTNILIDNGSTTQTYELTSAGGKLLSEKDEYNNAVTYTYTDGNVTKITDGSGRVFNVIYYTHSNGSKRVKSIRLPDKTQITFNYTSTEEDKISYIELPDKIVSLFTYDENGIITSIQQAYNVAPFTYGTKYEINFNNKKQVTQITEYGSDGTEGNYLNITYENDNTTEFSDRQGRKVTYTFDNSGNQVSKLNANGYLESGDSNGLSISSGADSFTKNYITESTQQNAVGSGKYYYKTNGSRNGVTSSGGTVTIDSSNPTEANGQVQYFGTTSIKVNNPKNSTNAAFFTGATHQIDDENTLSDLQGKDITFSAYVKTKDVAQIYDDGAIGATLKIKCYDSSGATLKEVNSIGITGTQDWQRLSISAKVPDNATKIRIFCNLRYTSGTAWFDCLQLEEGNCANDFNALQNSNFENNDNWLTNENSAISAQNGTVTIGGKAEAYENSVTVEETTAPEEEIQLATYYETVTETVPNDAIVTYDDYGNEIKKEQGFVNRTVKKTYLADTSVSETLPPETENTSTTNNLGNKYIYQQVNVGRSGVIFNIIGEAQAKSVPLSNENRTFGIALNIYYKNNAIPETHYKEFNSNTDKKQTVSLSVTPENDDKEIEYVAFAFVYGYNENEMTVHNAMLNISSRGYAVNDSTSSTESGGIEDAASETQDDICINSEIVSESVDKTKPYMQTSSSYDSTGNYVAAKTDEAGNTVNYTYDVNGKVTSTTDGEGNVVNYTYDSSGNISQVSSYDAQNDYYYNGAGQIAAIDHNDFRYSFNYNVLGKLISTKIGDVEITKNIYSSSTGNLYKTRFANGDYYQYYYDNYDNVTQIRSSSGNTTNFVYNKKGLVSKMIDYSSQEITYYYYDFNGNLTGEYRQLNSGALSYYLSYDKDGNRLEQTSVNGHIKTIKRGSEEDSTYVENDGIKVSSVTDDFSRTSRIITSREEGQSVFFTDYDYASGSAANTTTNLVSKITQKYESNELVNYEYAYDGNGNITQVKQNGSIVAKYNYDELNQLVWAADTNTGLYTQINYDNAGNITSVKEYALSTSGWHPSYLKQEKTYSYGDTNWKDKLTSYDGTTITYDKMGNPLSYRDSMSFEWKNGRQLSKITTGDKSVNMAYDTNGMRLLKSDGNYTTNYYYDSNNNLIGLDKAGSTLFFYYDSNGSPTAFKNNDIMYYYVKNLQGDIVKIVKQDGSVAATYTYDAWGKLLSVKDGSNVNVPASTTFHVANLNPYRYRGYIYDTETGLYYLQSRYYDPITGRFLNADDTQFIQSQVLSSNLYTYCLNNPINHVDYEGEMAMKPMPPFSIGNNVFYKANKIYKSMLMTVEMYLLALQNKKQNAIYDFSNKTDYIEKIKKSKLYQKVLNDHLKNINIYEIFERMIHENSIYRLIGEGSINFNEDEDEDLHLSIGKCDVLICIKKISSYVSGFTGQRVRKYYLQVNILDSYDFDKEDWNGVVNIVNNLLGYYPQELNVIVNYIWFININYEYEYVCKHGC